MGLRPILLDTNGYAAFKRGIPSAVELIQRVPLIGISVVVLGELFSGFAAGAREEQNRQELSTFLQSSRVKILSVDAKTAERYAAIFHELRQQGRPIPTNDMWIAATAIQHGYAVFSYDHHFESINELVVGSNLEAFLQS